MEKQKAFIVHANLPRCRWWSKETVAVVTGANKGIGYSLVRKLAELGLTVVLTSRDIPKGIEAVQSLAARGLHVEYRQLDLADPASIRAFASWLREVFGRLDVLVNNAGVSFNEMGENSVEHAEMVMRTNYYGPKLLTEALLPLFRRSESMSRILNISSRLGLLNKVQNPRVREVLSDEEGVSEEMIDGVVERFLEEVRNGSWGGGGWPKVWTDYAVSKLALNAYSRLLARRQERHRLSVNCFCPGFTKTSMTGGQGSHTADDAAHIGASIALLPHHNLPTGKFFIGYKISVFSKL
ncbi:hypothetical protein ACLOJK_011725 [Asimina triloba]